MDLYDCSGSLVRPSTRLMLAVILFIDYPRGPFVVCGVVSCPIALTGRACVFTWGNQKISWRVGGPNQQGGSRIVWAGHLHFYGSRICPSLAHLIIMRVFVASCCHYHCFDFFFHFRL